MSNEKRTYVYEYSKNGEGCAFWNEGKSIMNLGLRREKNKDYYELTINISPLVDGKMQYDEAAKRYVQGFFSISYFEIIELIKSIEYIKNGDLSVYTIEHVSEEGNGNIFRLEAGENNELFIDIENMSSNNVVDVFTHVLYDEKEIQINDAGDTISINLETERFLEILKSSVFALSGLGNAFKSLGGSSSNTGNSGGYVRNSGRRTSAGRKTLGDRNNQARSNSTADKNVKNISVDELDEFINN